MEDWHEKLTTAAWNGDIEALKLSLQNGADIDYQDGSGETALMRAAQEGHLEICRFLIDTGCKIDITDYRGLTALMWAASGGHLEICILLIDTGCKIDITTPGWGETALMRAARLGHLEICRLLIDRRCKIDITDELLGQTALMKAARWGHLEICRLLIDTGCKIDITNYDGETALMRAAWEGHLEICKLLIDTGCKIDITNNDGYTALHAAAERGYLQTTRCLVEQGGANPLVKTHEGQTPYDLAAECMQGQYKEVMEYLQLDSNLWQWLIQEETVMSEKSPGDTAGQEREGDMVPTEIKVMADKKSIDLYLKLLESGSEEKRDIRLVVVGKKGAGKTSMIRRLFGEDITNVDRTNGIEIHKIKCKAMSDDGIWKKLDGKNEEKEIHARLLKPIEERLSQDKEKIDTPVAAEASKPNKENKPRKNVNETEKLETEKPNLLVKPFGSEPQVESTVASLQPNKVFEEARKVIKTMTESKVDFKDKEEYATLLLWDFAGDKEFYHTHQTFLSPDAIYLVVTNLTKADDRKAKEMFQLWMNSIHCYCRLDDHKIYPGNNTTESDMKDPPVVLVGSHKDQVTPIAGEEIVDLCKKCIDTYVNDIPKVAQKHIQDEHFISNTAMTADEDIVFQNLRQSVLKLARKMTTWNTKYPLKFIQLEKHLQEMKKELPIISFDDLSKISTETPMPLNEKELMLFLKFHHEIRALVFFEDLKEYIILDTQWLSNAFKCIITAEKFQSNFNRHQFPSEWNEFNTKGILNSVVLEQILETNPTIFKFSERLNAYEHKDHILRVMEKFDIIIRPNIPDKDASNEKPPYYVPCMIKADPDVDIYQMFHVSETCKKSTWLCIKFMFLPPHLKNHLIASLSRKYKIAEVPVCGTNKRPIALFKSKAVFKLLEATNLLIMFFADHIQIQVWEFGQYDNIDKCYYKNIAEFVTAEIKQIISRRFKMTTVTFDQKLECYLQKPDCVKGSCEWNDMQTDYFCDICTQRHDNEWSEHQPVKPPKSSDAASVVKSDTESTSLSQCISKNEDTSQDTKSDFSDMLDQMITKLVISVDDRRTIEQNTDQENTMLDIVIKRGEPNKSVCIDVLMQNRRYKGLAQKLKSNSQSSVPPPTKTELPDVPDYKIRLQKNYLAIINKLKHNDK